MRTFDLRKHSGFRQANEKALLVLDDTHTYVLDSHPDTVIKVLNAIQTVEQNPEKIASTYKKIIKLALGSDDAYAAVMEQVSTFSGLIQLGDIIMALITGEDPETFAKKGSDAGE